MSLRGWVDERVVVAETTNGQRLNVVAGKTRDPHNPAARVGAFAIGDGPTVVLRQDGDVSNGSEIISVLRLTLAELLADERRGGV